VNDLDRLATACLLPGFPGERLPDWVRAALDDGLPGVALYGANATSEESLPALAAQVRAGWPHALVAVDEEGGDVTRLEYRRGSSRPGHQALGAVDDEALTRDVFRALAADLRAAGITVDLAPCVDVASDPRNPVIGARSFGADPALVARHGAAAVRGLQDGGVAAVVKHFPGHGATAEDSHVAAPVVDADEATVRARDLPPFAAAVRAGALAVMTGHVVLRALDPEPATLSRRLLVDLLRGELGFTGAVVTDALDMAAVRARHGVAGAAARALAAGADLLLLGAEDGATTHPDARAALVGAVRDGAVPEERLADAAARVAQLQRAVAALPPPGPVDRGVGLRAARAAVRVRGAVPLSRAELAGGVVVAEVRGEVNLAVGAAPWSVADAVARLGVRVEAVTVTGTRPWAADELPGDGALVIAVRDAHRVPWQHRAVEAVLRARPDAVLVGLGTPADTVLAEAVAGPAARWVLAHSAAAVSVRAAAEALVGRRG
jgi:beta-N-acetylhexosaminidase